MMQAHRLVTLVPFSAARQLLQAGQVVKLDVEIPVEFAPLGVMSQADAGEATQLLCAFLLESRGSLAKE